MTFLEKRRILQFGFDVFIDFFREHFHHEIAKKELKKSLFQIDQYIEKL